MDACALPKFAVVICKNITLNVIELSFSDSLRISVHYVLLITCLRVVSIHVETLDGEVLVLNWKLIAQSHTQI